MSYNRFLLTHKTNGVFLGMCLGLGFWSKLEDAGQDSACVFETADEILDMVSKWPNFDIKNMGIIPITTQDDYYATEQECISAGQEKWT